MPTIQIWNAPSLVPHRYRTLDCRRITGSRRRRVGIDEDGEFREGAWPPNLGAPQPRRTPASWRRDIFAGFRLGRRIPVLKGNIELEGLGGYFVYLGLYDAKSQLDTRGISRRLRLA